MHPRRPPRPLPDLAIDGPAVRFGAVAAVVGVLIEFGAGALHPGHVQPNDSVAVFQEYAASSVWTGVHIGQFVGGLLVALALIMLAASMPRTGPAGMLAFVGGIAAALVAAVFAVQMAVDGVALKSTIDAWMSAAPGDRSSAFFVAESVRDVEKGLSGFFHLLNGTALLALGAAVSTGRTYPRPLGWFGMAAGLGFIAGGVATAHTGFSPESSEILSPTALVGLVFLLGLAVAMWRRADGRAARSVPTGALASRGNAS